MIWKPVLS